MDKKLTLSLDAVVIEEAKRFAKEQGTSLSKLVEGYFQFIAKKNNKAEEPSQYYISPIVRKLSGVMRVEEPVDYDALKYEYLKKKLLD